MAKQSQTEAAIQILRDEMKVLELAIAKLQATQTAKAPRKERKGKKGASAQEAMDRL